MVKIPQWLSDYLNDDDVRVIEATVAQIEQQTEAEIVPVIVRSSSNYAQAQVTGALLVVLFFMFLLETLVPYLYWDYTSSAIVFAISAVAVIFFVVPWFTKKLWVRRLLTLRREEQEQCWKRAQIEFYENRLSSTKDRVGVLLFISLLEHMVIVLADQKIAEKLPQETWQHVVDRVVKNLKKKSAREGFLGGLKECSNLLIQHFPVKSGDKNELPNHLVIKD